MGYCVRCHAKKEMLSPTRTVMRNGCRAMIGHCACCGTKMSVAGLWDGDAQAHAVPDAAPRLPTAPAPPPPPRV